MIQVKSPSSRARCFTARGRSAASRRGPFVARGAGPLVLVALAGLLGCGGGAPAPTPEREPVPSSAEGGQIAPPSTEGGQIAPPPAEGGLIEPPSAPAGAEQAAGDEFDFRYGGGSIFTLLRLPPDELARVRSRYVAQRTAQLALPGARLTANQVAACTRARLNTAPNYAAADCAIVPGAVANGAACSDSVQCQSGYCDRSAGQEAGPNAEACGVCTPAVPVGQPCDWAKPCVPGAGCAQDTSNTCETLTYAKAKAPCDGVTALCDPGLTCFVNTCNAIASNFETDCEAPYGCGPKVDCQDLGGGIGRCHLPAASGSFCDSDADCATGLSCSSGSSARCLPLSWVEPGALCGGQARCRVGRCASSGKGTVCPRVIADGDACDPSDSTAVCDRFATCTGGVCALTPASSCM